MVAAQAMVVLAAPSLAWDKDPSVKPLVPVHFLETIVMETDWDTVMMPDQAWVLAMAMDLVTTA